MRRGDQQDAGRSQCDDSDGHGVTDECLAYGKHRSETTKSPPPSPLESLPAELRVMVLCRVPDLPTLRALVRASPILHAQYRHDRDEILRACLSRELEGLFVDAWANIESRVCTLGPRNDGVITSYIAYYRTWLSSPTPYPDVNSIKGGRLRWMAAYHLAIARPMALLYSNWALTNLKKTILSSTSQQGPGGTEIKEAVKEEPTAQTNRDIKLSRSEEIRIFRALYRYETFQHLFGINEGKRKGRFSSHEINYLFFSHFGPWETDAIGCIHTFVTHKYEDIFNQVKADLPHTHARSKQKNGTPDPYDPYDPFHAYDLEAHHDREHTCLPFRIFKAL